MANIYSRTSFSIKDLTPCESNWLQDEYERISTPVPPEVGSPEWDIDWGCIDQGSYHIGYCSFSLKSSDGLIYAEENFQIDQLVEFLQRFLMRFRPNSFIAFTWAETCDSMREDHFSGGTVVVTALDVNSSNGSHLIGLAQKRNLSSACSLVE